MRRFSLRVNMVDTLELDYEGFGEKDLPEVGLDIYTRDPATRPLMAAYSLNEGEWKQWEKHREPVPLELEQALMDSSVEKWSFNAQFERVYTNRVMKIPSPVKNWRCTQVLAYFQSFFGRLDQVGQQCGLPQEKQKMSEGKALIQLFCLPQAITKTNPHRIRDHRTDPERWQTFLDYNVQDCVAERAIRKRLWKFRPPEIEWIYYEIDQIINDRGMPIDMQYVLAAIEMSDRRKDELRTQMNKITGLANSGSRTQLLPWLRDRGYKFNDLQKESVEKVLTIHKARVDEGRESELTPECVAALKLRKWESKISVSKYKTIRDRAVNGRVRYLFQFCGASRTHRWAGRTIQTQNLSRTPKSISALDILTACTNIIRSGDYDMLALFMEEPMEALVGCVRSAFRAPEGEELVVADLSSIETCVIAWLTACKRLLQVIRERKDPYIDFATFMYNKRYEDVTKHERQICKPPVLGCGYRLGGGEMYNGKRTGLWGYADNMGVDMPRAEAHRAVELYRTTYPEVKESWKAIEEAVARCMRTEKPVQWGHIRFEREKPYLKMILPTGSVIYYYQPKMQLETVLAGRMIIKIATSEEDYFLHGARVGEEYEVEETYTRMGFSYMGKTQNGQSWVRIPSHGGRFIEQMTQSLARDIFAIGQRHAHEEGFKLVGHAHDENIGLKKIGDNYYTVAKLAECMTREIPQLPGMPLRAEGYTSPFYRKD